MCTIFVSTADSYQYQLQSMWQKCWNTNQSLVHNLRFRERGPLKSWRPETMAEAILSVLKEGLSLSQAARKYDIPYPTFVLYANRVHNLLGPSADGGAGKRRYRRVSDNKHNNNIIHHHCPRSTRGYSIYSCCKLCPAREHTACWLNFCFSIPIPTRHPAIGEPAVSKAGWHGEGDAQNRTHSLTRSKCSWTRSSFVFNPSYRLKPGWCSYLISYMIGRDSIFRAIVAPYTHRH